MFIISLKMQWRSACKIRLINSKLAGVLSNKEALVSARTVSQLSLTSAQLQILRDSLACWSCKIRGTGEVNTIRGPTMRCRLTCWEIKNLHMTYMSHVRTYISRLLHLIWHQRICWDLDQAIKYVTNSWLIWPITKFGWDKMKSRKCIKLASYMIGTTLFSVQLS